MPSEEILVLASSRKYGGRCVAGINKAGQWVRPVSGGHHGLFLTQCGIGGEWPEVLDVVRFGYVERLEDPVQPENLLTDDADWELRRKIPPGKAYERLVGYLDRGPRLLGNRGAAVKEDEAVQNADGSLALIEPAAGLSLLMRPPEEEHGKLKPRAVFSFGRRRYELPLTDVPIEEAVKAAGVGEYSPRDLGFEAAGRVLLTISLAEAYHDWHHKLAAAVLFLPVEA
jgi:Dual OB-containing domain